MNLSSIEDTENTEKDELVGAASRLRTEARKRFSQCRDISRAGVVRLDRNHCRCRGEPIAGLIV